MRVTAPNAFPPPTFDEVRGPRSELQALGQHTLDAVAARLVISFLATTLLGIVAVGRRPTLWPVLAALATGLSLFAFVDVLTRQRSVPWLLGALTGGVAASALLASLSASTNLDELHQVESWLAGGVVGGVCVSRGLAWGLGAYVSVAGVNLVVEHSLGGPAPLYTFLGAFAYYLGAGAVNLTARRGFVTTERALTATEQAAAAQRVAEERWAVGRQVDRQMHDTVLATLTVLSRRGVGVAVEDVRAACARDIQILQGSGIPTAVLVPDGQPTLEVEPDPNTRRAGSAITAAVALAEASGLTVRVHAADASWTVPLAPEVATALHDALREAVTNIGRHAAVGAFDVLINTSVDSLVVVVVDEGSGFDLSQVPPDRLGLRVSIGERLGTVGGSLAVWSTPERGTSVMMRVPLADPKPTPVAGEPAP
jgi:hypothetical protein